MLVFLKILFACFVGTAWYHLNGPEQSTIAFILFVMVLLLSFSKPIQYQDPARRDDYRYKIQEARARRIAVEEKRKQEKQLLKKQALEAEEAAKREFKKKFKL